MQTLQPTIHSTLFKKRAEDERMIIDAKAHPQEFAMLYKKYQQRIFHYFYYRVNYHEQTAEELTQEVFTRAFEHLNEFQISNASYYAYLHIIAHNLLINYYRKKKPLYIEDVSSHVFTHEDRHELFWLQEMLSSSLHVLSKDEKKVILLFYTQDTAVKDIATQMHKSENAVKLQLSHARKKIRTYIKKKNKYMHFSLGTQNDLSQLADDISQKQFVLIGEATHGTSEFYVYRATLTRYLIEQYGFQIVAVEGDWPDCLSINEYCAGHTPHSSALNALKTFQRWPSWMWANWEVVAFMDWLHAYNSEWKAEDKIRFYGLDIYGLWESLTMLLKRAKNYDLSVQEHIRETVRCFSEYGMNAQQYAHAIWDSDTDCADDVNELVKGLQRKQNHLTVKEDDFIASMHAFAIQHGEEYYRIMMEADNESWNVRDTHMADLIHELLKYYGTQTKIIIWAHNTHVGDARATDMRREGIVNIGQLLRQRYGNARTALVGFDFYEGEVMAGAEWDAPQNIFSTPPAQAGSWGHFFHNNYGGKNMVFTDLKNTPALQQTKGQRAIGVVYRPHHDTAQYVLTRLDQRYDAVIYVDKTTALHPLPIHIEEDLTEPELYPWGL